jgi:hypothetical protein
MQHLTLSPELSKLGEMYSGLARNAYKPVEQATAKAGSPNRRNAADLWVTRWSFLCRFNSARIRVSSSPPLPNAQSHWRPVPAMIPGDQGASGASTVGFVVHQVWVGS